VSKLRVHSSKIKGPLGLPPILQSQRRHSHQDREREIRKRGRRRVNEERGGRKGEEKLTFW
jgi:hypothetical protein